MAVQPKTDQSVGKQMSGADMIIHVLAEQGIDTIFGYSGGAILPTYDAIFRYNRENPDNTLNLVVPANEQGAGFMAAGYSRATGKVGVSLVTSGPAATNSVTPVRDCMADSVPMVLICGQVARAAVGTDAFQEAPVFSIMSSCAKHVFLVKDERELEATVRTAFEIARSGRPGPVVVDVPKDVQNYIGVYQGAGMLPLHGYQRRLELINGSRVADGHAARFFELLGAAKRPLIYAGGGVILGDAAQELRAFAEHFQIPVVTTLMGIGALDTAGDLCLRMLGMHGMAYANYAVMDCDFLFAVGARFDDRVCAVPKKFAGNAKIAHVDIDAAEIGKVKQVDWAHVGHAKIALRDLLAYGRDIKTDFSKWTARAREMKRLHHQDFNRDAEIIQPQRVCELLNEITKGEAIISTGVGQHQMFAAQHFDFKEPRMWLTSGSMGTMGFGLPAAIGAQFGRKDRIVVDIDGDGSLRMNMGELETCTTYNIPVKILLLNNFGDGMVVQWQTLYYEGRFSGTDKSLHKKDFVKAAQADGFEFARRVEREEDLKKTLEEFVAFPGPAFLEVIVDKEAFVYPMVGPGMYYDQMLTGPYITSREAIARDAKLDTSDSF
ncbi:MAG TPA: biosynthetic-type acetolactate synthase large subunit [Candidatus Hydrogenedentes bacterium]|nr:biosynthetic-type acetolactate synthase large subunit [Candidatus Hydrogenedentota bacterium]